MRQNRRQMDRGFTLVELMIVVAVIGVIASLAIPNYLRFTARTKRSEMLETISKIKLSFKNVYDNTGSFITTSTPAGPSGINPTAPVPVGQSASWDTHALGWVEFQFPPEGAVKMRYWYSISANGQDLIVTVCGSFAGVGDIAATCPPGMTGTANYSYYETFHGSGTSDQPIEFPLGLF